MQVPPLPVTVSPAVAPVLLSTMPLVAPLAEMLVKCSPSPPIAVLATLRAVPVVVVRELWTPFGSLTTTVPPPVALKAGLDPVDRMSPPSKRTVATALADIEIPPPSPSLRSVMRPLKSFVPRFWLATLTSCPTSSVIVPS